MTDLDLSYRPSSYWPADSPPDDGVEIAHVVVDSVLGDINTIVAFPDGDGRIRFAALTEGQKLADVEPSQAKDPLSLGELIELIDSADLGSDVKPGIVYGLLEMNGLVGSGNADDANFIRVGSEFYPELGEHYDQQTLAWVMGTA